MRLCNTNLVQRAFAAEAHPRPARLAPVHAKKSESDDMRIKSDEFMEELSTMKYRFRKPTKAQRSSLEIGWKLSGAKVRERGMQAS